MNETRVERARPEDRAALLELARDIRLFGPDDLAVIEELWNDFAARGEASQYHFLIARSDAEATGFACFGPRALTSGTYDLYWIGVRQDRQGGGIGRLLLERVMEEIRQRGGRLLIIETEGRAEYAPTRAFYERAGCQAEARIRDFYAPGNDLWIFTRRA